MMLFPELVTLSWLLRRQRNYLFLTGFCSLVFDYMVPDEFDEEELCMMQANPAYRVVLAEFCF
jgi:hypothetical protein